MESIYDEAVKNALVYRATQTIVKMSGLSYLFLFDFALGDGPNNRIVSSVFEEKVRAL